MIPVTAESPEIRNLQLEKIVVYLLRNGWRKLSHPNSHLTVFEGFVDDFGNPIQLVLPTSFEFWDSLMLIAKAINLLAAIEECQPTNILEKMELQDNGAIADYTKAISINPDDDAAYRSRGISKNILDDHEGAIADYSKAISINPDFADAYINRGVTKSALGDYEGAIADYSIAISINPDDAYNHIYRGITKSDFGDFEGAITDYSKAIEFESFQIHLPYLQRLAANTRSRLGAYYVSEGRWYDALEQFQASLDYYRQTDNLERRADLLTQIARVQLLLGDWDKARMLYRDALRLYVHLDKKEGIANCHLALGRMMLRLNYITEAQQEIQTACNLFSECGLSQRQAEAKEVLQVISQFKSKQTLRI